jgi:ubiquinone/menaquinone biosynthesis C-methylase UbiE
MRSTALALYPPRPRMRVLDVGCGTGAVLARYAAAGCLVTGLDASADMLAEGCRRYGSGAVLVQGDATALPFGGGSTDLVVATMLFHSLSPRVRVAALAEMARVAGDGGRVLVADYRAVPPRGLRQRWARWAAQAVETLAGHVGGVRSLRAAGGVAALAPAAGLVVEAEVAAAGGAIGVILLRRGGAVA